MRTTLAIAVAILAAGCSFGPQNACDNYGFHRGTVEFSRCLQTEETTQRQVYATNASAIAVDTWPRPRR
jgi:hypothetical protein